MRGAQENPATVNLAWTHAGTGSPILYILSGYTYNTILKVSSIHEDLLPENLEDNLGSARSLKHRPTHTYPPRAHDESLILLWSMGHLQSVSKFHTAVLM